MSYACIPISQVVVEKIFSSRLAWASKTLLQTKTKKTMAGGQGYSSVVNACLACTRTWVWILR